MLDLAKFKQKIVDSGIVDASQLERAQKHSFDMSISLSEALLNLNLATYRGLGKCFSELYELPYVGVCTNPPPEEARQQIAAKCAVRWKVLPVAYAADTGIFTLAIHDPDQISKIEQVYRFFLQPHALGFVITSKAESDKAFETYYGVVRPQAMRDAEDKTRSAAKKMKLSGLRKSGDPSGNEAASAPAAESAPASQPSEQQTPSVDVAVPAPPPPPPTAPPPGMPPPTKPTTVKMSGSALRRALTVRPAGEALGVPGAGPKPWSRYNRSATTAGATPDIPYSDMSRALLSAVAMLVRVHTADDPLKTLQTRARVRYCQLLAGRLAMTQPQTDATIVAAWLSMIQDKPDIINHLPTPYKIEELLPAEGASAPASDRLEAQVIGLVRAFQDLKQKDPAAAKDIILARRNLRASWSSAPERQGVLEAFLQLLLDEEFLSQLDRKTGNILVVDPSEIAAATMTPPLINDGYNVVIVGNGTAAEEKFSENPPDLILAAADPARQTVARMCQKARKSAKTATVPIVVLVDKQDEKLAAEYLRAGADDVLTKPVDLEVLFLRINRLMKPKDDGSAEKGVQGSLADMNFTDMIQILCAGGKSMEIMLTSGKLQGSVYVQNGNVVHAVLGDQEGNGAFYELMRWVSGEFTTRQCAEFSKRTIQTSLMSMLMEGAQRADEAAALQ